MQDEHYHFQTKRLRTDSTCLGDTPSISHLFESTLTTEAANNKETINCLIGTLQRLRDGDENVPYISSNIDVLNTLATTAHCCTSTSLARENANQLVATSAANISNPHSMESRVPALQTVPCIFPQQKSISFPGVEIFNHLAWDSTSLQGFTFNQQVQQRQMQQPFTFSQICYDPNKTNLLNARTRVLNHAPDYSSSTSKNLTSQLITTGADSCYHGLKLDEVHRKQHIMGKTKSTHGNQTDSSLVANYLTMFNSQPQCAGVPVTSAVNGVPSSQMLAVRPLPRQRKQPHLHGSTSTMWFSKVQLLNNQHLEPVYEEDAKEQDTVIVDCSDRECNEWSIYSVPLPTQLHVRCHCFQNKP
ncbi:hypothetical protein RB195_013892 [Necator americanus]|uniref:Uncharacterized protein n=1 Tax=Necator americanus TaxID=51031 RepID=A0ABR1DXR2_NECAM